MAALAHQSTEERIGIGAAVVVHVALAAGLAWVAQQRDMIPSDPPERVMVSLATEVSLESTAPDPSAEPAASMAPEVSDLPTPPEAAVVPQRAPEVRPTNTPRVAPTTRATTRSVPTPAPTATQAPRGSRLNDNFLAGTSDSTGDSGSPAAVVGPAQQASIAQAIIRQLRPHWSPPSGVDVDQLVTIVRFRLNRDGSLAGAPEVVRTTGQNDSNRNQVSRHQEQALRAVRLAAPFNLPEEYYSGWRTITSNFDNRLAQ